MQHKAYQTCSTFACLNDDVQGFRYEMGLDCLGATELPHENVVVGIK